MAFDNRQSDDDQSLRPYGEAIDIAARAPSAISVAVTAAGAASVWAWRRAHRRRADQRGR